MVVRERDPASVAEDCPTEARTPGGGSGPRGRLVGRFPLDDRRLLLALICFDCSGLLSFDLHLSRATSQPCKLTYQRIYVISRRLDNPRRAVCEPLVLVRLCPLLQPRLSWFLLFETLLNCPFPHCISLFPRVFRPSASDHPALIVFNCPQVHLGFTSGPARSQASPDDSCPIVARISYIPTIWFPLILIDPRTWTPARPNRRLVATPHTPRRLLSPSHPRFNLLLPPTCPLRLKHLAPISLIQPRRISQSLCASRPARPHPRTAFSLPPSRPLPALLRPLPWGRAPRQLYPRLRLVYLPYPYLPPRAVVCDELGQAAARNQRTFLPSSTPRPRATGVTLQTSRRRRPAIRPRSPATTQRCLLHHMSARPVALSFSSSQCSRTRIHSHSNSKSLQSSVVPLQCPRRSLPSCKLPRRHPVCHQRHLLPQNRSRRLSSPVQAYLPPSTLSTTRTMGSRTSLMYRRLEQMCRRPEQMVSPVRRQSRIGGGAIRP